MLKEVPQKFWQGAFVEVLGQTWVAPTPPGKDLAKDAELEYSGINLNTTAFKGEPSDYNGSREPELRDDFAIYLNHGRDDDDVIPFDEPEIG